MRIDVVERELPQRTNVRSRKRLHAARAVWPRWDSRAEAVRFKLDGMPGADCLIERKALQFLCGETRLDPEACIEIYRENRAWIDELARTELEGCASVQRVALSLALVRFHLACESVELPEVLCI